jgi:hypothetical protein
LRAIQQPIRQGIPDSLIFRSERFQDGRAIVFEDSEYSQEAFGQIKRIHGMICFCGSRWQGEVERRAKSAVTVGSDPSAMRFDDRLAD